MKRSLETKFHELTTAALQCFAVCRELFLHACDANFLQHASPFLRSYGKRLGRVMDRESIILQLCQRPHSKRETLARAKDASGVVQPDEHDPSYGSYLINHPLPIEVFVDHPRG
jgi:hypothetical protein